MRCSANILSRIAAFPVKQSKISSLLTYALPFHTYNRFGPARVRPVPGLFILVWCMATHSANKRRITYLRRLTSRHAQVVPGSIGLRTNSSNSPFSISRSNVPQAVMHAHNIKPSRAHRINNSFRRHFGPRCRECKACAHTWQGTA